MVLCFVSACRRHCHGVSFVKNIFNNEVVFTLKISMTWEECTTSQLARL